MNANMRKKKLPEIPGASFRQFRGDRLSWGFFGFSFFPRLNSFREGRWVSDELGVELQRSFCFCFCVVQTKRNSPALIAIQDGGAFAFFAIICSLDLDVLELRRQMKGAQSDFGAPAFGGLTQLSGEVKGHHGCNSFFVVGDQLIKIMAANEIPQHSAWSFGANLLIDPLYFVNKGIQQGAIKAIVFVGNILPIYILGNEIFNLCENRGNGFPISRGAGASQPLLRLRLIYRGE